MRYFFLLTILWGAAMCGAQNAQSGLSNGSKYAVSNDKKPVTKGEAASALKQTGNALADVLHLSPKAISSGLPNSDAALTREDAILAMYKIFVACRPEFVIRPGKAAFDSSRFVLHGKKAAEAASTLVSYGCIPPVAPLLTGPKDSLTPAEFGDALGYFISRIAELTHTPSSRFSPLLKKMG